MGPTTGGRPDQVSLIFARRLKRTGFEYRYTTAGTVESFVKAQRLRASVGDVRPAYRYERDVEAFFQHSPAVVRSPERR